jgi:hypothetical protein
VRDVRLLALADVDGRLGIFDTVLLLCGNVGLAGSGEETEALMRRLHKVTSPSARIVLDSVDPYVGGDEADAAYHARNRAAGRMPGQVTIRIRYGERSTPWFELLCLSAAELGRLADATGWRLARVLPGEPPDYYAVLEKERQSS